MKKNKFGLILCLMMTLFSAFVFSACGKTKGSVTFLQSHIEIGLNQEINIADYVDVKGVKLEDIVFTSNDSNIVMVTPRNTLVTGDAVGVVLIQAEGYVGGIEISVIKQEDNFDAPANLRYVQSENRLYWDTVYKNGTVAPVYRVNLTVNGTAYRPRTVSTNYTEITGDGTIVATVECMASTTIGQSAPSLEYSFTKLPQATNIKYNNTTKQLTWSRGEHDALTTAYYVKVNGVVSNKLSNEENKIYTYDLDLTKQGSYSISVISALKDEQGTNVFGSESEKLTLTRLNPVELNVVNGNITWEDNQTGVYQYKVTVIDENGNQTSEVIQKKSNNTVYSLQSQTAGKYTVKVKAIGDNGDNDNNPNGDVYQTYKHYLPSTETQTDEVEKLQTPAIIYDRDESTISVTNLDLTKEFNLALKIKDATGSETEVDISESREYTNQFLTAGTYEISVVNKSINDNQINSEASNVITIVRLDQIKNINQLVDQDNFYKLEGLTNPNIKYTVTQTYFPKDEQPVSKILTLNNDSYGKANELFAKAGDYEIQILCEGNFDDDNIYLSSVTDLKVHKLQTIQPVLDEDNKEITWDKVSSFNGEIYTYELISENTTYAKNSNQELDKLDTTTFTYGDKGVGSYKIKFVTTLKENSNSDKNLMVLDSDVSEQIIFHVTMDISPVTLSFDRNTNGYSLFLNKVNGADTYNIKINNIDLSKEEYQLFATSEQGSSQIELDLTKILVEKGEYFQKYRIMSDDLDKTLSYTIEVVAINTSEVNNQDSNDYGIKYYKDSQVSTLNVKRLKAPNAININKDLQLSVANNADNPDNSIERYHMTINGVTATKISGNEITYNVQVKNIGKLGVTVGENKVYYLDSDVSELTFERLQPKISIYGYNFLFNKNETDNNDTSFTPELILKQGNSQKLINIDTASELKMDISTLDLSSFNLKNTQAQPVEVSLNYRLNIENSTINIAGEYVNGRYQSTGTLFNINGSSNVVRIQYANQELGVNVKEQIINGESKVNVTWTNDGQDYTLFANGTDIQDNKTYSTNLDSEIFATTTGDAQDTYKLALLKKSTIDTRLQTQDSVVYSDIYMFEINRLKPVTQIRINQDNFEKQTNAHANFKVYYNSEEISDLSVISGDVAQTVVAKFVVEDNYRPSNFEFYLSSFASEFNFKRYIKVGVRNEAVLKISENKIMWNNDDDFPVDPDTHNKEMYYQFRFTNFNDANDTGASGNIERIYKHQQMSEGTNSYYEIPLTSLTFENLLSEITGTSKYFAIKKVHEQFVAVKGSDVINYLSSDYTDLTLLKIIPTPTQIYIYVDGESSDADNIINVSCNVTKEDQNLINQGYSIDSYQIYFAFGNETERPFVTSNSTKYKINYSSDEFVSNGYLQETGEWKIAIKVLGTGDSVVSGKSSQKTFIRLAKTSSINVAEDGVIDFAYVQNATGYKVECVYNDKNGVQQTISEKINETASDKLKSSILKEVLNDNQISSGDVIVRVYSLGDKDSNNKVTKYLSNVQEVKFTKLKTPDVSFGQDCLTINSAETNYAGYITDNKLPIRIKVEKVGEESTNKLFTSAYAQKDENGNYKYYYSDLLKSENIDENQQTQLKFSIYIYNNIANSNIIKSETVTKNVIRLKVVENIYFERNVDNNDQTDDLVALYGQNNNSYKNTKLIIGNKTYNCEHYDANNPNLFRIYITDTMLGELTADAGANGGTWNIKLIAWGDSSSENVYINSNALSVYGNIAENVIAQDINTEGGILNWKAVNRASKYTLKVTPKDATSPHYKTGYTGNLTKEKFTDYDAGTYNIAVKSMGNVDTTLNFKNIDGTINSIVLDGVYSQEVTVQKLNQIQNVNFLHGYFTFDTVDRATSYKVELYNNLNNSPLVTLTLSTKELLNEPEKIVYYNDDISNYLIEHNSLKLKIYAYAGEVDDNSEIKYLINSSYSTFNYNNTNNDYITIQRLNNQTITTAPNVYQQLIQKPISGVTGTEIDYLSTYLYWLANTTTGVADSNGNYHFEVKLDNTNTIVTSLTENGVTFGDFLIDKDFALTVGDHTISFRQLGSNSIDENGNVYLPAVFTDPTTVTKIQDVKIELSSKQISSNQEDTENILTFTDINNADSYLLYINDNENHYKQIGKANDVLNTEILFDILQNAQVCDAFYIRPINTTSLNVIAGNKIVFTIGSNIIPAKIQKLDNSKLSNIKFKDGVMYFEIDDVIVNLINNQQQKITVKFTSVANQTDYIYTDKLYNFVQKVTLPEFINLSDLFKGGFGELNYSFQEFASSLPTGDYRVSIKLVGDYTLQENEIYDVVLFSSNYTKVGTVYVGPAPIVSGMIKGEEYYITFANPVVSTKYYTSAPSFRVIGYDNYGNKEILGTVSAKELNKTEEIVFNLTELVNNLGQEGKVQLTSKIVGISVQMLGFGEDVLNDDIVLNGKVSNIFKVKILDPVVSQVTDGVIQIKGQSGASKLQVLYTKEHSTSDPIKDYTDYGSTTSYDWYDLDTSHLSVAKYSAQLQAIGTIGGNSVNDVIYINRGNVMTVSSIKITIPEIEKLPSIKEEINGVDIVDGSYQWEHINNASAYKVLFRPSGSTAEYEYSRVSISNVNQNEFIYYDSVVNNTNCYVYNFVTIGTLKADITNNKNQLVYADTVYVNSSPSGDNYGSRIGSIKEITFDQGILKWENSLEGNNKTNYYRLTFVNVDIDNGNNPIGDTVVVHTSDSYYDVNSNPDLTSFGNWQVNIQSAYASKTAKDSTVIQGKEISNYHLIGLQLENPSQYYKFEAVTNIKVIDGTISWAYANQGNKNNSDYRFKLDFEISDKNKHETRYVAGNQTSLKDVIFDDLTIQTTDNIKLSITVVPEVEVTSNYVKSTTTVYKYADDDAVNPGQVRYIHQYAVIDNSNIEIKLTDNNTTIRIDWSNAFATDLTENRTYDLKYTVVNKKTNQIEMQVNQSGITDTYFDFPKEVSISDTILSFSICTNPSSEDYITSAWSDVREISSPDEAKGLTYNYNTHALTWTPYAEINETNIRSYQYKIKDEIVDENGNVIKTYIIVKNLGNEQYLPFEIGKHKLSVAVIITGSSGSDSEDGKDPSISGYVTYKDENDNDIIDFNIYKSGSGTYDDPYQISTASEFENIKYRLNKSTQSILGTYYIEYPESTGKLKDEVFDSTEVYFFKQTADLTLVKDKIKEIDNTLSSLAFTNKDIGFNNDYNGSGFKTTLNYVVNNNDFDKVTIFNKVDSKASIYNIKLYIDFKDSNNISNTITLQGVSGRNSANIYLLATENKGQIHDIYVGESNNTLFITLQSANLNYSLVGNNNGELYNIINHYNVNIQRSTITETLTVNFAFITVYNNYQVSAVKNLGSITLRNVAPILLGGLVGQNVSSNSELTRSVNKGDITIVFNNISKSSVGGLVAENNGKISYSYVMNTFNISGSISGTDVYVGGLMGSTNGGTYNKIYINSVFNIDSSTRLSAYQLASKISGSTFNYNQGIYCSTKYGITASTAEVNKYTNILELNNSSLIETNGNFIGSNSTYDYPYLRWETGLFAG